MSKNISLKKSVIANSLAIVKNWLKNIISKKSKATENTPSVCNRAMFQEKLKAAIQRNIRADKYLVLLFLDLDSFKIVNDSLGHDAGDELLLQVAKRLEDNVRKTDTIAHLGGDEFAVLFEQIDSPSRISVSAKKVNDAFAEPFTIKDTQVSVTASIGIAVASKAMLDHQTLINQADTAMYLAKAKGKNNFQYFTEELNAEVHRKMQLSSQLYHALKRQELKPNYQPQINMRTNEIVGMEVLLRWVNVEFGNVSPAEFIPIAEDNGLIIPISEWLIKTACGHTLEFEQLNHAMQDIHISINLSPRHFNNKNLLSFIKNTLAEIKILPQHIVFEITESLLIGNRQETKGLLTQLKDLGVSISLDDFGTGYSSLSYLHQFPIDILKIDQSFIKGLFVDPKNASIVSAIISLSKSLNLMVIAEGVETKEMAEFLLANGCDIGQGYLYAKPMPAEDIINWKL